MFAYIGNINLFSYLLNLRETESSRQIKVSSLLSTPQMPEFWGTEAGSWELKPALPAGCQEPTMWAIYTVSQDSISRKLELGAEARSWTLMWGVDILILGLLPGQDTHSCNMLFEHFHGVYHLTFGFVLDFWCKYFVKIVCTKITNCLCYYIWNLRHS